jgi:polygalacturonase
MEGLTIEDGPMWTVHPVYSKNVKLINLNIKTTGPNTDGIALDSVDTALIKGGNFSCGDDCIVIKSGTDYDGWKQNKPSKNIRISSVTMDTGNGGVTIGSEMSGGVENVIVENSSFNNIDSGIRIKSTPGRGGYIRNISYRNIKMNNVKDHAIQINAKYSYATVDSTGGKEPDIEGITIDNVIAKGVKKSFDIKGLDLTPIRGLKFSDIFIESDKDKAEIGRIQDVSDIMLDNVVIKNLGGKETLILNNLQNVYIKGKIDYLTGGMRYAKIQGEKSKNIHLLLSPCKNNECVSVADEVDKNAIVGR